MGETGQIIGARNINGNIVAMQHRMGVVIRPTIARTKKYPSDMREQMPTVVCSGPNKEPEYNSEGPETFRAQAQIYGPMKTGSTTYSANHEAEMFKDTDVPVALETLVPEMEKLFWNH